MFRPGKPRHQRPVVEALEPKLLYSADLGLSAFVPAGSQASLQSALHQLQIDQTLSATDANLNTPQQASHDIVFIDAAVPDADSLVRDIAQQAAQGRHIEAIVIRADEDGLSRITQTLQARHDVSAVHLIGHGQSGDMQLGHTQLDAQTLMARAGEIAQWGNALTTQADLLLYGCDVALGTPGQALVQSLAALTGADVAASDDLTGSAQLGGNWTLEVQTGHIDSAQALSATMQAQWDGVLVQAAPSTKGTAIWSDSGDASPQQRKWDGLTFGDQTNTATLSTWKVMTSAESPTRNEAIAVGVDSSGAIRAERWDGTQWAATNTNPLATGTVPDRQGFAVAYEQRSGDAMLVWNSGTALRYSVFNGTTWSAAATVSAYAGTAPQNMHIAAQPTGDQMALVVTDASGDDYALIWDGSAWGHAVLLDNSGTGSADQLSTAVAYESLTGRAMVAYAKANDANVYYRIYNGSSWSTAATVGTFGETATPYAMTLVTDPTTNRIGLGFLSTGASDASQVSLDVWTGSAWGTRLVADSYTDTSPSANVALGFESVSGDLLAVYGGDASAVRYRTWTSAGSWTAQATGPTTGVPGVSRLFSDPYTNHLMLGVQAESGAVSFTDWDGSAFGTSSTVTNNSGSTNTPAFTWLWRNNIDGNNLNTLLLGDSADATGLHGVNSVSDTEVLSFTDPGLIYGDNNTNGTFNHVVDLGALGASGVDDMVMVSRSLTLATGISVQRGDILFTTTNSSTLTNADGSTLAVNNDDVVRFRPSVAGHYDSGTFSILVQALGSTRVGVSLITVPSGLNIRGLALVEQSTVVGGTTLAAGTILFTSGTGTAAANIQRFVPSSGLLTGGQLVGSGASTLITGSNIGINQAVTGLEVVSADAPLQNGTLGAGSLLISLDQADSSVGNNGNGTGNSYDNGYRSGYGYGYGSGSGSWNSSGNTGIGIAVNQGDVVILTLASSTSATATILMRGSNVGATGQVFDSLALRMDAAPVITSNGGASTATISVAENSTAVTTVTATDADTGTTLTYSITGGADASRFQINASTGALSLVQAMDFEDPISAANSNAYLVTVAASDGTYSTTQAITVNITNVNEAPTITSNGGHSGFIFLGYTYIDIPNGATTATTVKAFDPDAGGSLTYSVSGLSASSFSINSSTGVLSFKSPATYNANGGNSYIVTVSARDAGGLSDSQDIIFSVQSGSTVTNYAPAINSNGGSSTASTSVAEQQTYVTTVTASNSDDNTYTYSITGGADQSFFQINAQTGDLNFKNAPLASAPADSGANNIYVVTVRVTDGTYSDSQTLNVTVLPYNRPPVNTLPIAFNTNEDTTVNISGVSVADSDAGSNTLSVSFSVEQGTLSVLNSVASGLSSSQITYANNNHRVTLSGTASAINTTLAATGGLTYLGGANFNGSDTLTMVTNDLGNSGVARSPAQTTDTDTALITSAALNDAPAPVASSDNLTYTEGDAPTAIDAAIALNDVDYGSYSGAVVQITGNYVNGEDILSFSDQLGITGSWDAGTGTLTLSGGATIHDYQTALRAVKYNNPSDNPDTTARTVTYSFGDGIATGSTTRGITVVAVNDPPVLTNAATALSYLENGAATAIDTSVQISDVDSASYTAATVTITGHYVNGQDVLSFVNQLGITGSWNAGTGTLTLTGSSSLANYQSALRAVAYRNTSNNPDTADRTITFSIDEGNGAGTAAATVHVTAVNDAPVLATTASPQTFTVGGSAIAIDPDLVTSDLDNTTFTGAQVAFTGLYVGAEDVLSFVDQLGITGTWDAGNGMLTLQGTASIASYQTALRTITYLNTSLTPDTTTRQLTFTVDDGGLNGTTSDTRGIIIALTNNPPSLTTSGTTLQYQEKDTTPIDPALTLSDSDTYTFASGYVQVTGHYVQGQDVLSMADQSGLTSTWDATTGKLTIVGATSTANYEAALRSVAYTNTSANPDTATRTVTFSVSDGGPEVTATLDIDIGTINDAPALTTSPDPLAYREGDTATLVDDALTFTDPDSTPYNGASVIISGNFVAGEDALSFTDQLGITGDWTGDTLTLSGDASVADYQTALRSVRYVNNSQNPDTNPRTLTFYVYTNANAVLESATATRDITIEAVNNSPSLSGSSGSMTYSEGDPATLIDSAMNFTDIDTSIYLGATVQITSHLASDQDVLAFVDQSGITGTWTANTGTLALHGAATVSDYEAALRSITYLNTSIAPDTNTRTVSFSVYAADAIIDTADTTVDIVVHANYSPPVLTKSSGDLAYQESSPATPVDAGLTLADIDSSTFVSATVQISGNFVSAEDVLSFTDQLGITGTWSNDTLTLIGTASEADYQTALRSVTYRNTSNTPNTGTRTVTFSITDSDMQAGTVSRDIVILPSDNAPVITTNNVALQYTENDPATAIDPSLTLTDADTTMYDGATISIDNYVAGEDVLGFTDQSGITGTLTGGTLELRGTASIGAYEAAMRSVTYTNTSNNPDATPRTVTFLINDLTYSSSSSRDIDITVNNDAPVLSATNGAMQYAEKDPATAIDPGLSISDFDSTAYAGATIEITGHFVPSEDVLTFTDQLGITGAWDGTQLHLTGTASLADYQTALRSITYANTSDNPDASVDRTVTFTLIESDLQTTGSVTRNITITPFNNPPVLSATNGAMQYAEKDPATAIDPGLAISDLDSTSYAGATIEITGHFVPSEDVLTFTNQLGITGSWDGTQLHLTGTASLAAYQAALRSITYANTSNNPDASADRTVTFTLIESDLQTTGSVTRNITITPFNNPPVLSATNGAMQYTEKDPATAIDPGLTISDLDSTSYAGATVEITGHFVPSEDVLTFTNQLGITGAWNGTQLHLTGTASLAAYQTALRGITYTNTSSNPDVSADRIVTFTLIEADLQTSGSVTRGITVTPVNDPPAVTHNSLSVEQSGSAAPAIQITDPDTSASNITLAVSGITGGHFVNTQTQNDVTQFSYADVLAGDILFVQDGSPTTPNYVLTVSDGQSSSTAPAVSTAFNPVIAPPPNTTPEVPNAPPSTAPSGGGTPAPPPAEAPPQAANLSAPLPVAPPPDTASGLAADLNRGPVIDIALREPVSTTKQVIEVQARDTAKTEAIAVAVEPESFQFSWGADLQSVINPDEMRRNLDALQDQLQEQGTEHKHVVASSIALTTGLSVGYVIWLVRGGALIGSMLSAMPAWQMIDPLPVLTRSRAQDGSGTDGEDDQPVEHLFDGDDHDEPTPPPKPDTTSGAHPVTHTEPEVRT